MQKKSGLGRGLNTLIPEAEEGKEGLNNVEMMRITQIEPNPDQPRTSFDSDKLEALSKSIGEYGVISPIIVRKNENNNYYMIIAGERRWRAAKMAGLKEVPVIIKEYDEQTVSEIALIENLQREDLNPMEESAGFAALLEKFDLTQEEISEKVGKSRSAVANSLRLLNLCESVRKLVELQEISAGHARALLGVGDPVLQEELAYEVIKKELSVRQTEQLVNQAKKKRENPEEIPQVIHIAAKELQEGLSKRLGTKVTVKQNAKKGKIEIEFYDKESLNQILSHIK